MPRPTRFSPEVRARAVRMVVEHEAAHESQWAAITSIAEKIGCTAETLRKWVRQAERDAGTRPGLTTEERPAAQAARAGELRAAARQRDSEEGLRVFRPGGARPPSEMMVRFIAQPSVPRRRAQAGDVDVGPSPSTPGTSTPGRRGERRRRPIASTWRAEGAGRPEPSSRPTRRRRSRPVGQPAPEGNDSGGQHRRPACRRRRRPIASRAGAEGAGTSTHRRRGHRRRGDVGNVDVGPSHRGRGRPAARRHRRGAGADRRG